MIYTYFFQCSELYLILTSMAIIFYVDFILLCVRPFFFFYFTLCFKDELGLVFLRT